MKQNGRRGPCRTWRFYGGVALAGAAIAAPVVAHALIRRRLRAPHFPCWGRTHRYAGHLGPVVFQELGAGPPMVLLHALGPGYDVQQWRGAAEAMAAHFRVFAPDLPGWGRSAAPEPGAEASLAILADFLTGVVRDPAVLVGAGLSAAYAVRLAADHPERVRALALVDPAGLTFDPDDGVAGGAGAAAATPASKSEDGMPPAPLVPVAPPDLPTSLAPLPPLAPAEGRSHPAVAQLLGVPLLRESVLDALTSRAALRHYLRCYAYAAPERVDAALLEHHYRVSHLPAHRQALAAYWRGELAVPADAALRRLGVPVWIAWGAGHPGHPADPLDGWLSLLPPGSRSEVFEGSRALPHAEQPLAFSNALGRFLGQLPA